MFFFFNDTATTEIYTLSLHDALPISVDHDASWPGLDPHAGDRVLALAGRISAPLAIELGPVLLRRGLLCFGLLRLDQRSEEHTSELQSRQYLVCRLLLEKKKKSYTTIDTRSNTSSPRAPAARPTINRAVSTRQARGRRAVSEQITSYRPSSPAVRSSMSA